jgi:hypothetical protein
MSVTKLCILVMMIVWEECGFPHGITTYALAQETRGHRSPDGDSTSSSQLNSHAFLRTTSTIYSSPITDGYAKMTPPFKSHSFNSPNKEKGWKPLAHPGVKLVQWLRHSRREGYLKRFASHGKKGMENKSLFRHGQNMRGTMRYARSSTYATTESHDKSMNDSNSGSGSDTIREHGNMSYYKSVWKSPNEEKENETYLHHERTLNMKENVLRNIPQAFYSSSSPTPSRFFKQLTFTLEKVQENVDEPQYQYRSKNLKKAGKTSGAIISNSSSKAPCHYHRGRHSHSSSDCIFTITFPSPTRIPTESSSFSTSSLSTTTHHSNQMTGGAVRETMDSNRESIESSIVISSSPASLLSSQIPSQSKDEVTSSPSSTRSDETRVSPLLVKWTRPAPSVSSSRLMNFQNTQLMTRPTVRASYPEESFQFTEEPWNIVNKPVEPSSYSSAPFSASLLLHSSSLSSSFETASSSDSYEYEQAFSAESRPTLSPSLSLPLLGASSSPLSLQAFNRFGKPRLSSTMPNNAYTKELRPILSHLEGSTFAKTPDKLMNYSSNDLNNPVNGLLSEDGSLNDTWVSGSSDTSSEIWDRNLKGSSTHPSVRGTTPLAQINSVGEDEESLSVLSLDINTTTMRTLSSSSVSKIHISIEVDERDELVKTFKAQHPVKLWALVGFYDEEYLHHINSHWLQFKPADPLTHKILGILYGVLMVVGCGGNLLVIVMFIR